MVTVRHSVRRNQMKPESKKMDLKHTVGYCGDLFAAPRPGDRDNWNVSRRRVIMSHGVCWNRPRGLETDTRIFRTVQ